MVQLWPVGVAAIFRGASRDARMREPSSIYSPPLSLNTVEFRIGNYLSRPRVGHVRMKSLWQSRSARTIGARPEGALINCAISNPIALMES